MRNKKLLSALVAAIAIVCIFAFLRDDSTRHAKQICDNAFSFLAPYHSSAKAGDGAVSTGIVEIAPSILCDGMEECRHLDSAVLAKVAKCLRLRGLPMEEIQTRARIDEASQNRLGFENTTYVFKIKSVQSAPAQKKSLN